MPRFTSHEEGRDSNAVFRDGDIVEIAKVISYDKETGQFKWLVNRGSHVKAGSSAGQPHIRGYIQITVFGMKYLAHRLAWAMSTGSWPEKTIDHINGDRSDNKISNLRLATVAENTRNGAIRAANTSGFKGVSYIPSTKRYRATITINYQQKFLGTYATAEEAHMAYVSAANKYHGEFSRVA